MSPSAATQSIRNHKNLLLLTTSYPLQESSTSGIFVKKLVDSLKDFHTVTVICPDDNSTFSKAKTIHRCRYAPKAMQVLAHSYGGIPVALRNNPLLYLLVPFLIWSMFFNTLTRVFKAEAVIANWSINALIAALPCWLSNKKLICVLRGEDVKIENSLIKSILLRLALRLSDKTVLVSHDMYHWLGTQYPHWKHKMQVIPNGVDERLLENNTAADSTNTDRINLLTVGSLIPRKGIDSIINALSDNRLAEINLQLTIVGDGEQAPKLKQQVRDLRLEDKVSFRGQLSHEDVVDLYASHQIFILASFHEGRPNVLVEAMAAGCCIIASKINGVIELVSQDKNGLLFAPGYVEELSENIFKACVTENRKKLGKNARNLVIEQKLTWSNTAQTYADMVGRLVDNTKSHHTTKVDK